MDFGAVATTARTARRGGRRGAPSLCKQRDRAAACSVLFFSLALFFFFRPADVVDVGDLGPSRSSCLASLDWDAALLGAHEQARKMHAVMRSRTRLRRRGLRKPEKTTMLDKRTNNYDNKDSCKDDDDNNNNEQRPAAPHSLWWFGWGHGGTRGAARGDDAVGAWPRHRPDGPRHAGRSRRFRSARRGGNNKAVVAAGGGAMAAAGAVVYLCPFTLSLAVGRLASMVLSYVLLRGGGWMVRWVVPAAVDVLAMASLSSVVTALRR